MINWQDEKSQLQIKNLERALINVEILTLLEETMRAWITLLKLHVDAFPPS